MNDEFELPEDYMGGEKGSRVIYIQKESRAATSSKETIYNTLIVAAIVALVGAVWTLREAVTTLQVTQQYMERRLDALEKRP